MARIFIALGGDAGGVAGVVGVRGGGSTLFFTASPTDADDMNGINNDDNGTVDNREKRRRAARLSALLYAKAAGIWRAFSYNHKDDIPLMRSARIN